MSWLWGLKPVQTEAGTLSLYTALQYCLPQVLMNIISALKHSNKQVSVVGLLAAPVYLEERTRW